MLYLLYVYIITTTGIQHKCNYSVSLLMFRVQQKMYTRQEYWFMSIAVVLKYLTCCDKQWHFKTSWFSNRQKVYTKYIETHKINNNNNNNKYTIYIILLTSKAWQVNLEWILFEGILEVPEKKLNNNLNATTHNSKGFCSFKIMYLFWNSNNTEIIEIVLQLSFILIHCYQTSFKYRNTSSKMSSCFMWCSKVRL